MQRRQLLARTARATVAVLGAPLLGTLASAARAASAWPDRTIRLIVPFPPGGGTDTVSRLIADHLSTPLHWTVVVENRAGAAGNIGLDAVAKASPDGYTLGMGQTSNLAINPALYPKMPFDPLKDLRALAPVSEQPVVLVVRQDSPLKTLADLLREAHTKADGVSIAQAGMGTVGHLAGELLARQTGAKLLQVPYKGAGPAMTDLLGRQVDAYFGASASVYPQFKAGQVRALCVSSLRRLPAMGQVPTIAELGHPGFEATTWLGLVGPARVPDEVVLRVNREVARILAQPEVQARLAADGNLATPGTPQALASHIQAEHAKWSALIRDAHIQVS